MHIISGILTDWLTEAELQWAMLLQINTILFSCEVMRQKTNLSPILTTKQQYSRSRAVVLQMLLNKQANNNLPAARKWEAMVVERLTNSTLQEHQQAAENSQVGCVPIRQSAASAVTVKTDHGLSRHPLHNGCTMDTIRHSWHSIYCQYNHMYVAC